MKIDNPRIVLVEGDTDREAAAQLLRPLGVDFGRTKSRWPIQSKESKEKVLAAIPVELESRSKQNSTATSAVSALGIVIDADDDAKATWQAVRNLLVDHHGGRQNLMPSAPIGRPALFSSLLNDSLMIGVWLMPDNRNVGTLEDFLLGAAACKSGLTYSWEVTPGGLASWSPRQRTQNEITKAVFGCYRSFGPNPDASYGTNIAHDSVIDHSAGSIPTFVEWIREVLQK